MFKKGQGQLVAFVLLIGFTVVIGIMVGNWAVQKAKKTGGDIAETGDIDAMCADVSIAQICEGTVAKVKNKGNFKIKLKTGNTYVGGTASLWLYPGGVSSAIALNNQVLPFIDRGGKEFGCPNRDIKIEEC